MKILIGLAVLSLYVVCSSAQTGQVVATNCPGRNSSNAQSPVVIREEVKQWQGVVLLLCFGAFALFISLVHRLIRTHVYYDAHLLDTFFDAGSDVNMGLVACGVVARWTWTSAFTNPSNDVYRYGLVGQFWYSAALVVPIFLFGIMASEIRIKAPGAKTFLQVIKSRFGTPAHIILMIFAFILNIMVVGMVVMEGVQIMTSVTQSLNEEVICIIVACIVGLYTVLGGVGGGLYVGYFFTAIITCITMVVLCDFYFDPVNRDEQKYGSISEIYDRMTCTTPDDNNDRKSGLTFISENGMFAGIVYTLAGFGMVFVDQSYWQISIAAKPNQCLWGFIISGFAWAVVPVCFSLAVGMGYWALTVDSGTTHLLGEEMLRNGTLPVFVMQNIFSSPDGSFMMFVLAACAIIPTASAQVLSASSIVVYDIYMTYVAPFRPAVVPEKQMNLRMQKAIRNEEYLEYDRRCVVLKHVVVVSISVLIIPIVLIMLAINIDIWYMFTFTALIVNSCVAPICLAITWHRITSWGVSAGSLAGFIVGFVVWLVYSSTYEGGIQDFRNNTGEYRPLVAGLASSLCIGAIICLIVSLSCGGCDSDLVEEEEWEKTRQIDNPILPWSVKYAPDIKSKYITKGRPHFYTVRRTFKCTEITAYVMGVLLAVCSVLVWPALMLTADIFSSSQFNGWVWFVLIWGIIICFLILLLPLIWEIVSVCKQAFYNRMWARSDRLDEVSSEHGSVRPEPEPAPTPAPAPLPDQTSMSSDGRNTLERERWKTFIHLD